MDDKDHYERGMAVRRKVAGNAWVDRANADKISLFEKMAGGGRGGARRRQGAAGFQSFRLFEPKNLHCQGRRIGSVAT